jgi:hypothetical protein
MNMSRATPPARPRPPAVALPQLPCCRATEPVVMGHCSVPLAGHFLDVQLRSRLYVRQLVCARGASRQTLARRGGGHGNGRYWAVAIGTNTPDKDGEFLILTLVIL